MIKGSGRSLLALLSGAALSACAGAASYGAANHGAASPGEASVRGEEVPILAIDTHVDTTQRMLDANDDIGVRVQGGHLDLPRMREGGLSGAYFSLWINPGTHEGEAAWERTKALAAAVQRLADTHPDQAVVCRSSSEVRAAWKAGKIALLMGVEGGHALGSDDPETVIARLREAYGFGARYMTITWSTDNPLGHSSTGENPEAGLTDLGRQVVEEMNRLGIVVDVSHVSDKTFYDIMEVTRSPVFASHSSSRAIADHPRNMTDDMIRLTGERGGAVCINYYSQYIDAEYRAHRNRIEEEHAERFNALDESIPDWISRSEAKTKLALELDPSLRQPGIEKLVQHFARVIEVAGESAVCLGSDFDGVGELPVGLEDVSRLPVLRTALSKHGYDVHAIFGGNVLRIMEANEKGAKVE